MKYLTINQIMFAFLVSYKITIKIPNRRLRQCYLSSMEENTSNLRETLFAESLSGPEESVRTLNRVIAKAINSRNEFLTFAGKANSQSLFDFCMEVKERRDQFALALQHRVSAMGGEPATDENFSGWIHHVWSRTRLALEADSDYVIASESMREEESMQLALGEALDSGHIPVDLKNVFQQEQEFSIRIHGVMEDLKMKLKPEDFIDVNRD